MRPATAAEGQLADWLARLLVLLAAQGEPTTGLLARVVAGHSAVLELDGARLWLRARAEPPVAVDIEAADLHAQADGLVRSTGDTLRAVIDGAALLDAVVADDRLHLRAPLAQLLAFHELALHLIWLGPRHAGLQALWAEFDAHWPTAVPRSALLDGQAAQHGALGQAVPARVQQARSPLAPVRSRAQGAPGS